MINVAIFGAGKIGSAVDGILATTRSYPYTDINKFVVDSNPIRLFEMGSKNSLVNVDHATVEDLATMLKRRKTTHVINAMPFFLNEKIATAAAMAGCHYIDFTEDDEMAKIVKEIYKGTGLTCAVKCGLAPGFINYIGYSLVDGIDTPDALTISVGALPRTVSFSADHPEKSYNLSWSIDGLVNEYIRPCQVKTDGILREVPALSKLEKVIIDGFEYEAALTSGGVGSLAVDLTNVPNVCYKTLRYPGHYKYVTDAVNRNLGDFAKIKEEFLRVFPQTDDDVIVVYATAEGRMDDGGYVRRAFASKFYGTDGFSGIQSTTAGSGVAILELMLKDKIRGIVGHTDVSLSAFTDTIAFKKYYKTSK